MSKIEYPIGGYAPGHYICKCCNCQEEFTGDKRAVQCEPCAINLINKSNIEAAHELCKLKSDLTKLKDSISNISKLLNL